MAKPSENLPQPKWIEPEDFEFICFNLTRKLMTYDEPIPDYSTRDKALLEASLAIPRQTFDKKLLYPDLLSQATALFYFLIKNHPFLNGNKRIAVMSLLIFLSLNEKWLNMSPRLLYEIAILISKSDPKEKDDVISVTKDRFNEYVVNYESWKKNKKRKK